MAAGQASAPRADGTRRARRSGRHGAALALAATLIATAACGARWSDSERTFVVNRGAASGQHATTSGTGDAGATATTLAAGTSGDVAAGGTTGGAGTTGGTTTGGTTGGAASGPAPC